MNMSNEKNMKLNNFLFDSIEADDYNLTSIYLKNYSTIKIKRHPSKQNKKLVCVLGVLVNKLGLKIEKEMINWLSKEYEIYKVYQKYPGSLYEYPALRFSQWLSENKNLSFLLYLHTKGATHHKITNRVLLVRKLWKHEFTMPRNLLYISDILNNKTDITTPLSKGAITWYNGMYISNRAFQLNKIFTNNNRYIYEYYFKNKNTRIKGIISDNCSRTTPFLKSFEKKMRIAKVKNTPTLNKSFETSWFYRIFYNPNYSLLLYFFLFVYIIKLIKRKVK